MSDMFNHEMDAYDQAEALGWQFDEPDTYSHSPRRLRRYQKECIAEFVAQPCSDDMYDMEVTKVHRESEKAFLISGAAKFDRPIDGFHEFTFKEIWLPKSRCDFNGNIARVPRWLLRRKLDAVFGENDD